MEPELTELMGHHNNKTPGDEVWAGNRNEGMYTGRSVESVAAALDEGYELVRPGLVGREGYETGGSGGMGSAPNAEGANKGSHKSAE